MIDYNDNHFLFLVYFLTDFALSDLLSPAFSAGDFFCGRCSLRTVIKNRIIRLDFLFKLWYNSTVSEIEPVIMGVSPVQGSPVNHVRRGTEQH